MCGLYYSEKVIFESLVGVFIILKTKNRLRRILPLKRYFFNCGAVYQLVLAKIPPLFFDIWIWPEARKFGDVHFIFLWKTCIFKGKNPPDFSPRCPWTPFHSAARPHFFSVGLLPAGPPARPPPRATPKVPCSGTMRGVPVRVGGGHWILGTGF